MCWTRPRNCVHRLSGSSRTRSRATRTSPAPISGGYRRHRRLDVGVALLARQLDGAVRDDVLLHLRRTGADRCVALVAVEAGAPALVARAPAAPRPGAGPGRAGAGLLVSGARPGGAR